MEHPDPAVSSWFYYKKFTGLYLKI